MVEPEGQQDECCVGLTLVAHGKGVPPKFEHFTCEVYDRDAGKAASAAFAVIVRELLESGYGLDRSKDAVAVHTAEPHRLELCEVGKPPTPQANPARWRCHVVVAAPTGQLSVATGALPSPFAALTAAFGALARAGRDVELEHVKRTPRPLRESVLEDVVSDVRGIAWKLERLRQGAEDGERARLLRYAAEDVGNAIDNLEGAMSCVKSSR